MCLAYAYQEHFVAIEIDVRSLKGVSKAHVPYRNAFKFSAIRHHEFSYPLYRKSSRLQQHRHYLIASNGLPW